MAAALAHTRLDFVALKGVSHVLKDDPTDSITNYAKDQPLSQQFVGALDGFFELLTRLVTHAPGKSRTRALAWRP